MKLLALLLLAFSFGLLAAAKPDPDACGDPAMPAPVDKVSCGDFLSDLGCKWDSDHISCIQRCRHQKGLNRYIYHNHRYYDITVEEYDKIMAAEEKASACKSKTAGANKTKTTRKHASSTGKSSGFKTVTRTITHVARWPTTEAEVSATRTFTKVWSNGTPIVASQTAGAEPEEEHHHPSIDHYCSSEFQMYKCRQKCAHHDFIFGIGKKKCERKCHEKCHKKHPLYPDGQGSSVVKRADNNDTATDDAELTTSY